MDKNDNGLPVSKPFNMADMIEYSDDSIVSRTLVKKDTGTVTLFACDRGQEISEHSTPYDALVTLLDGEALLVIGGEKIRASAGETVLMPANVPHALKAERRYKKLLVMIKG